MIKLSEGWTLFLDRDGVINNRIPDGYIASAEQFQFIDGVKEAIKLLSNSFERIIVVTNQQGIGKGLMTEKQLELIHNKMLEQINEAGGRIDLILFSPDLKGRNSFTRKPSVGMGLKARKIFPGIKFNKSIMVGDTPSDIIFGYRLGMKTALISNNVNEINSCSEMLTYRFDDLLSFAKAVSLSKM